ncbi:uncharacterized protein DUF1080 [Marinilabilia salmonicolor]|jgi:hypothetical protein|uniref:3-keto-disaccharide hydrolase n=1 Tax=Marinilabilia salmonicolor TaxID=989 RepID=UPI000D04F242|nr:DUF1080 domain-containing protein [Marinilabilia salmonicolor]PRZ02243.1 uncharacterized protein DUF1080 [Marinilabilia salmonicolor]
MKHHTQFSIAVAILTALSLTSFSPEDEWENLLNKDLSKWEMYLSFKHQNAYNGSQPLDENGDTIAPVGYNKNINNVFSVIEENGVPVLKITGEYYGAVFTKESFSNYHLKLKVKWGDKKWEPRKDKLLDSGLLYHSNGEAGVDYWRSWMLSQEFQIMEGHMGDYWAIGNTAIDVRAFPQEGMMNTVAGHEEPFIPIGGSSGRDAFCLRSADYESAPGEWTTLELICFNGKSLHIVNGEVVMVLQNSRMTTEEGTQPLESGKIQIQSEAGEVYFKDIKIKQLDQFPGQYEKFFH